MGLTASADTIAVRDVARPRARRRRGWWPPVVMLVAVAAAAGWPVVGNHDFYFWDDSAAVGVPVWHLIAQSVLHGHLPLLDLDMWRGGDLAAEAATGMWNPVMVAVAIAIYPIDNLALGITLGKTFFILLLAAGTYLLARDFGIRPWPAAAIGTAVPLAGYSFFMDGPAWVNALMLTAFTPWVWWTARRTARDGRSPLWLVGTGYLAVSIGNPYGILVTAFVLLAVAVEFRRRIRTLLLSGVAVALLNVTVYLPLLLTTSVGFRAGSGTFNEGFLKPSLTNLLELSTPAAQPFMVNFNTSIGQNNLAIPVAYLAWFVLPTLPWLRYRLLRERWRDHLGLYVFAGVFLLLMLGPSQIWMFRWPLRLIDFFWFPVLLLWALLADQGWQRDRRAIRAGVSLGLVVVGAYLAWGERTDTWRWDLLGALVVIVLTGLLLRFGTGVLIAGSLLILGMQVLWFPANTTVTDYNFPTSVALLHSRFAKYHGTTVQLANLQLDKSARTPSGQYQDELYGSEFSVAGVDSTTAYSGIGYTALDSALCEAYQGSTSCPGAWTSLWHHPDGYPVPLADLLRATTIVVQNSLLDTRNTPPPGWHRTAADENSGLTTVWTRDTPLPWSGRLSYAPADVHVTADDMTGQVGERVGYRTTGDDPQTLVFARLAWPGYTATVNGTPVAAQAGPDGLLTVTLPANVHNGQLALHWAPPGHRRSAVAFLAGLLLTIGLAVMRRA